MKKSFFSLVFIPIVSYAEVSIIDNSDASFNIISGNWKTSNSVSGAENNEYIHDQNATSFSQVNWDFSVENPNLLYKVQAKWTSHPNRAQRAKYTVNHASGSDTVFIDQREQGSEFVDLGEYIGPTSVTLDNSGHYGEGAGGYIIADSVRVESISPPKASNGSALIPQWRAGDPTSGRYWFMTYYITNVSDSPSSVTLYFYDQHNNLITDDNNVSTGMLNESIENIALNYTEPQNASAKFDLEAGKTINLTLNTLNVKSWGWGRIEWEKSNDFTTSVSLMAHSYEDFQVSGNARRSSMSINQGKPF